MTILNALVVNAGSTSVKLTRRIDGQFVTAPPSLDDALADERAPAVVVYRVVHGGDRTAPGILDDRVVQELRALTELAPLQQPPALNAIDQCRERWPDATHIACFDTAFHTSMPIEARTYALPARLREKVRVYGFHGLSHAWAAGRLRAARPDARRVMIAHLGGGQSLCGVLDGRSFATTMGFTPLDGLVMATRSGAIDPGALLWLSKHTDEDLDHVLENESGLMGLAGTDDMRSVVTRAEAGDAQADFALRVWLHRFLRQAGGCIAVLGGVDAIAFTGGIGEHSAAIRRRAVAGLAWLGARIADDPEDEAVDDFRDISAPEATVSAFVVHAREDLQMLHEASSLAG